MAKRAIVKTGGSTIEGMLSVTYGVVNGRDPDGRPNKKRRSLGITILREADESNSVSGWTKSSAASDRRDGSIEFMHKDGKTMKTLKWTGGYVTDYSIRGGGETDHPVEQFTIMAETMEFDGKKLDLQWGKGQ